jgi:hypothetical protein
MGARRPARRRRCRGRPVAVSGRGVRRGARSDPAGGVVVAPAAADPAGGVRSSGSGRGVRRYRRGVEFRTRPNTGSLLRESDYRNCVTGIRIAESVFANQFSGFEFRESGFANRNGSLNP